MSGNTTKIVAVVAVAIVVIAAVAFVFTGEDEEVEELQLDGSLEVFGNADRDYKIDNKDLDIVKKIVNNESGYTFEEYPRADADNDGKVTQADVDLVQKIINKEKTRIYIVNDTITEKYVDWTNYPVTDAVSTGTSPMLTMCKMAGIMDHIRGTSYYGNWGLDPILFPDICDDPSVGKGANYFDFETVSSMKTTEGVDTIITQTWMPENKSQFNDVGIGVVMVNPKSTSVQECSSALLLLGFLFNESNQAREISQWFQDLMDYIDGELVGVKNTVTMVTANSKGDAISPEAGDYAQLALVCGAEYPPELQGVTGSTKVGDWIYDVTVDCHIGILSSPSGTSWYDKDMDKTVFKEKMANFKDTRAYIDGDIYVIPMDAPIPVKIMYCAVALHPDQFSLDWANEKHNEFCEKFYHGDFDPKELDFFMTADELKTGI